MKIFIFLCMLFCFKFTFAQTKDIHVYAFVAEECPISIYMAGALSEIAQSYNSKADFNLVFPLKSSNNKTANLFKTKNKLPLYNIVLDKNQSISKQLGATVTPEVIITDADNKVVYKGRINDAYLEPGKRRHIFGSNDLNNALAMITEGKEFPKPWKNAIGCYITYTKK
jgi:thiol-disulfide isomerase/thioredoxin